MRGSVGRSSQAGVRQVAVRVQEWRVVLTVADVRKQQADCPSDKGVCKSHKNSFIWRHAWWFILADVEEEKQPFLKCPQLIGHFFIVWQGVFITWG